MRMLRAVFLAGNIFVKRFAQSVVAGCRFREVAPGITNDCGNATEVEQRVVELQNRLISAVLLRQAAGEMPTIFLNARLKAASDS